jgi:uncharacterized protein YbjT (DUF2867 family)
MDVVTGAFSYTGRAIAEELLHRGRQVRTLTRRHPREDPLKGRIDEAILQFDDPAVLRRSLSGVDTLYNTYWVRYARGATTFERAVANTRALFAAAADAGVRRVVHLSVTNPTLDSPLPYFRGKAQTEADVAASGLPYDILINNIAWALRRFPIFPISGDGGYGVQPIAVHDVAAICADAGETTDNLVVDAAGPEVFAYRELVRTVADALGSHSRIVASPHRLAALLANLVGAIHRDIALTSDELAGLEASLLISHQPPLGATDFRAWITATAPTIGHAYASELARNFRDHQPL